ncbi:hypothetical protein EI77_00244 [Prosthecobacter fusiformis]|uniref:Uncharacterized protein n=1 Tax=Prosthecobacter fusiformis TaxID=48464 RepID=A0A4R7SP13_9BACT|nr:hypothetical protein [Prosthecobacter fusiformis]TDU80942.1 hypothetical protein EI77_00244 [Prosthecobacter fusiformis]
MKGILVLILAAAVGYVAYQYVYPIIADSMKFEKHKPQEVVVAPKPVPKKEVAVVAPPKPVVEAPAPVMDAPKPAPAPMVPKFEAPKPKEGEFVAPDFPPIEVAVKNWTVIPKSAFPRQVKMKKDLNLQMKIGSSSASTQVKAGGAMYAVGQEGTEILVSPTQTSPMRGKVGLDDTDLKEILTDIYERWKVARTETLRRAHEFKLAAAERSKNAPPPTQGAMASASNDKPARDADGTYPLLVSSMKSGQVTEIKMDNIKEWGEPQMTDGVWTVIVKYETQTMFGKFDTEAQAQIKNGKVEKWIYTGSGEEVP